MAYRFPTPSSGEGDAGREGKELPGLYKACCRRMGRVLSGWMETGGAGVQCRV